MLDERSSKDRDSTSLGSTNFMYSSFFLLFIVMKNNVKEIITEAVLGFLNESAEKKKSKDKKESDTSFDADTKKKFLKAIQTKDR